MATSANADELTRIDLDRASTSAPAREPEVERAGDGLFAEPSTSAPAREPEVWDERIAEFNPLFAHTPEPEPVALSPPMAASAFDIDEYLQRERSKDLLRFSTAGSVDDGKSTLIGRLLYDTMSVYDDQLRSIEGKGTTQPGVLDLALLTDGLRAEREQGITIDVAYRYFSTAHRKFIIADTPGHEQYTRNMATGASTADVAIVLIDARKGVLVQSRRHASITALLGVRHVIVAVNKMDLVGYAQPVFAQIQEAFSSFFHALGIDGQQAIALHFVPVSALTGDNVVHATAAMPWYTGPTLLGLLESIPSSATVAAAPFRFAVQRVVRPDLDFRGFAGQIASGTVRVGDAVTVLPSGRSSRVQRIVTYDGDLPEASAPLSVTITLEDEIDISRGDLLVSPDRPATVTSALTASLVWMDAEPMQIGRRYLLKHTSRTVPVRVAKLLRTVQLSEVAQDTAASLGLNAIGLVAVESLLPIAVDAYAQNRGTGSFVLIDPQSNATVAAGMIRTIEADAASSHAGPVTPAERATRFGHIGALLQVSGPPSLAESLERHLFQRGANVLLSDADDSIAAALADVGLLVIRVDDSPVETQPASVTLQGFDTLPLPNGEEDLAQTLDAVLSLLRSAGILTQENLHA